MALGAYLKSRGKEKEKKKKRNDTGDDLVSFGSVLQQGYCICQ